MGKMRDLDELEQLFDKAASEWENRIVMRGANRMGTGARDECKKLTQTRTGSMKKSWFFRIDHKKGEIVIWLSNPMEYAPYVNNGHRIVRAKKVVGYMAGKRWLEHGIENYRVHYMKDDVNKMLQELKGAMK